MFKNFLKIITCGAIVLCTNLHAADAGMGGVAPLTFSDSAWTSIPNPGTLSAEEVMALFAGPSEKDGREWSLDSFNNDELRAILADRQFDVKTLMDEAVFAHHPFAVDREGYIRYEFFLVSLTQFYPAEEADEPDTMYNLNTPLPIKTKLTPAELENPIVHALQSTLTFEEQRKLFRENPGEFARTEGTKKARNLLIFALPEKRSEIAALLAEETD